MWGLRGVAWTACPVRFPGPHDESSALGFSGFGILREKEGGPGFLLGNISRAPCYSHMQLSRVRHWRCEKPAGPV